MPIIHMGSTRNNKELNELQIVLSRLHSCIEKMEDILVCGDPDLNHDLLQGQIDIYEKRADEILIDIQKLRGEL